MKHFASREFWVYYKALPKDVQKLADKSFALIKTNPRHPSLHLKKVDHFWVARVGLHYRTLAIAIDSGILWFWIGTHSEYNRLVG